MRALFVVLAFCILPGSGFGAQLPSAAIPDTVKNPEESGGARILPENPKATTTGSDIDGRGLDLDGHGYACITMKLRRQDGGITKVRKCND